MRSIRGWLRAFERPIRSCGRKDVSIALQRAETIHQLTLRLMRRWWTSSLHVISATSRSIVLISTTLCWRVVRVIIPLICPAVSLSLIIWIVVTAAGVILMIVVPVVGIVIVALVVVSCLRLVRISIVSWRGRPPGARGRVGRRPSLRIRHCLALLCSREPAVDVDRLTV